MSKPFKGVIKTRRSRLEARLGAVHPAESPGRARRTSSSCSTTTPASRRGRPSAARINMPTLQTARRQRPDVLAVAHDGAAAHRRVRRFLTGATTTMNRMACDHRGLDRIPGRRTGTSRRMRRRSPQVMRQDNGYSTFWLGKNHNVPVEDIARRRARQSEWPLHQGFDRFYGFLGGETNNWYPISSRTTASSTQPYQPEEGYHLSKDLADKAIQMIRDLKASSSLEALVHLVLPRREPRAAPRPEGIRRQVQGPVRRRLRGVPRVGARRA